MERQAEKHEKLVKISQYLENCLTNHYPTIFTDANGIEETTIVNDGEVLRMVLRGVAFEDTMFDSFEPVEGTDSRLLREFTLNRNELCSCRFKFVISIPVIVNGRDSTGSLLCSLNLGPPGNTGGIETETLKIVLNHEGREYASSGTSGWFENELIDIQKELPSDMFMKACINCQFSDYSPAGHGFFGCMYCYRNIKSEYLKVKTKQDFFQILQKAERSVQETYLCEEFERRVPGTGYRG